MLLRVSKTDLNAYKSINEALKVCQSFDILEIEEGIYKEKVEVTVDHLTIRGIGKTVITYDDYGKKIHSDGTLLQTFRSYTFLVLSDSVIIENITIENSSGYGEHIGQAIAVYIDGDDLLMKNCHLIGRQDTLFCGPLPKEPVIPGSFIGPSLIKPRKQSTQYYINTTIEGDVDFIFGSGKAYFIDCTMKSLDRSQECNGYVFAPSTDEESDTGFVAINCNLTHEKSMKAETCYLARPWRSFGKVELIGCVIGPHIKSGYWDYWGNKKNMQTARFSCI